MKDADAGTAPLYGAIYKRRECADLSGTSGLGIPPMQTGFAAVILANRLPVRNNARPGIAA